MLFLYHADGSDFDGVEFVHDFPSGTTDEEACVNVTLHLDGVVEPEESLNIQLTLNDTSSVQTGATLRTIFIGNSDRE